MRTLVLSSAIPELASGRAAPSTWRSCRNSSGIRLRTDLSKLPYSDRIIELGAELAVLQVRFCQCHAQPDVQYQLFRKFRFSTRTGFARISTEDEKKDRETLLITGASVATGGMLAEIRREAQTGTGSLLPS